MRKDDYLHRIHVVLIFTIMIGVLRILVHHSEGLDLRYTGLTRGGGCGAAGMFLIDFICQKVTRKYDRDRKEDCRIKIQLKKTEDRQLSPGAGVGWRPEIPCYRRRRRRRARGGTGRRRTTSRPPGSRGRRSRSSAARIPGWWLH